MSARLSKRPDSDAQHNATMRHQGLYDGASEILGPLQDGERVEYREAFSTKERRSLRLLVGLNLISGVMFIGFLLWPTHLPEVSGVPTLLAITGMLALGLMLIVELIRLAQTGALLAFASKAKDPVPLKPLPGKRVAVLTTIVPGKEPLDLVVRTLKAMKKLDHDGVLDVWLLDEGDNPDVALACWALDVNHFSRKGVAEWNTDSGPFKARTKHGNHNAWRAAHEHNYDVVAQMDPDHVPNGDFLTRTLGYFNDEDVAFVVAPQVYGNMDESWIAHGAAVQAYVFHGVVQRGGNGMSAPLLIGTNHLYRPTAFAQIGGYQDSIIEDHLTSMAIYAETNPVSGRTWKGVYTPDVLAVGEGPTTFTDYFNQQKRWAYGIWEIAGKHSPRVLAKSRPAQRFSFALLQSFYPSVAISFVSGILLSLIYVLGGATAQLPLIPWFLFWAASMIANLGTFFWYRRFNLAPHERDELGLRGLGLFLITIPVYVAAGVQFLRRRPLSYAVTAKGDLASPDNVRTFLPHIPWIGVSLALIAVTLLNWELGSLVLLFWLLVTLSVGSAGLVIHLVSARRRRVAGGRPGTHGDAGAGSDAAASSESAAPAAVEVSREPELAA